MFVSKIENKSYFCSLHISCRLHNTNINDVLTILLLEFCFLLFCSKSSCEVGYNFKLVAVFISAKLESQAFWS